MVQFRPRGEMQKWPVELTLSTCQVCAISIGSMTISIIYSNMNTIGHVMKNIWTNGGALLFSNRIHMAQFPSHGINHMIISLRNSNSIDISFRYDSSHGGQEIVINLHYSDVIMSVMASQIACILIVCSAVCSGEDQRKHQSSTSVTFVRGIHMWPVNSPHKGPVTRKILPSDDVIML